MPNALRRRRLESLPRRIDEVSDRDGTSWPGAPDYTQAAEAVFEWFKAHRGPCSFAPARAARSCALATIFFGWTPGERGRKRKYSALMLQQTGMLQTTNGGRSFFDAIASLAVTHGEERDHLAWLHTDVAHPDDLVQPEQQGTRDCQDHARGDRDHEERRQCRPDHPGGRRTRWRPIRFLKGRRSGRIRPGRDRTAGRQFHLRSG